jgi:hypothetical protein
LLFFSINIFRRKKMATKYTDVQIQNLTHRAAVCAVGKGYSTDYSVRVIPIALLPERVAVKLEAYEEDYSFSLELSAWKEALISAMKDH